MKQTVTITRAADRHSEQHSRDFAYSYWATVPAGSLESVLSEAAAQIGSLPVGKYDINVDWPHD